MHQGRYQRRQRISLMKKKHVQLKKLINYQYRTTSFRMKRLMNKSLFNLEIQQINVHMSTIMKHVTLEEVMAITAEYQIHTDNRNNKTTTHEQHLLSVDNSFKEKVRTHTIERESNCVATM